MATTIIAITTNQITDLGTVIMAEIINLIITTDLGTITTIIDLTTTAIITETMKDLVVRDH